MCARLSVKESEPRSEAPICRPPTSPLTVSVNRAVPAPTVLAAAPAIVRGPCPPVVAFSPPEPPQPARSSPAARTIGSARTATIVPCLEMDDDGPRRPRRVVGPQDLDERRRRGRPLGAGIAGEVADDRRVEAQHRAVERRQDDVVGNECRPEAGTREPHGALGL